MDPVQAFLQANALTPPAFAPTSRYYGIATAQLTQADGRTIVFVQRRFLPPPENFALLQSITIVAGDRLDNLAARYLGDPQQYWRLVRCQRRDAARGAASPTSARRLPITLPEGVPAPEGRCRLAARQGHPADADDGADHPAAGAARGDGRARQRRGAHLRRRGERLPAHVPVHQQVRAQHDLPDRGRHHTSMATPPLRVMLIVTLNGTPQPLFDGVMTNVEVQAGNQGSPGTVTVTGEDLTKVMDMQDFSGLPFPAMPIEARVALLCAKYAPFGIIPLLIPILFPDVPIPIDKIPAQKGTDLQYIRQLADEVGYVFYIEPGPDARHQHRLLRARDQGRRAAAGAQHRHGRADQRRVAELQLRPDQGRAADRLHPEPADAGADPDPDPEHQPAAAAARA